MNIFEEIKGLVVQIVKSEFGEVDENILSRIAVEPPKNPEHGDLSTNAAMLLAKPLKSNPREVAQKIVGSNKWEVESLDIAGAGFINIKLNKADHLNVLKSCLENKRKFGNNNQGGNLKTNIEFVSANPTGPMHIGHARGAVVGDALANILKKSGYDVTKEYYINDAGSQIETLLESAKCRMEGKDIPEGLYPGEYLIPVGEKLKELPEGEWRGYVVKAMLDNIKQDLKGLGVEHDIFTSEKEIVDSGAIGKAIDKLRDSGLIYEGVLEPPKGKVIEDYEALPQTLFKSAQFGDDVDRAVIKNDGGTTYFASDIAYHEDKYNRGFNYQIVSLGADHGGYIKRLKAATKAISDGDAELEVVIHQLVNFMEDGVAIKMSKRAGKFKTVKDVLDDVGKDILRFVMLTKKSDSTLDFDLVKVKEQSKDNPVFYVQYAHARCNSILNKALNDSGLKPEISAVDKLKSEHDFNLIKKISEFPRIVAQSAEHLEPHRIAYYLYELAGEFHSLYNMGKQDGELQFIIESNVELAKARLCLVEAAKCVIDEGLRLLGVTAMEAM